MTTREGVGLERQRYDAIAEQLAQRHMGVVATKMFGMPTLKVDGKVFGGFSDGAMVFKLAGEAYTRALNLAGARRFDPSRRSRQVKAWLLVPFSHSAMWEALAEEAIASVTGVA